MGLNKALKYLLFVTAIILCQLNLLGQDRINDSLKLALKNAKHDTVRCNILNVLIELEGDDNIWPVYNKQLEDIARKNLSNNDVSRKTYLKHFASAMNNKGFLANQKGDIPGALECFHKCIEVYQQIGDKQGMATSLNNLAYVYHKQGDIKAALDYHHKGLKICEEIGNKITIGTALNNIGLIYYYLGDLKQALVYYQKSVKYRTETGDKAGLGATYNNIGMIYSKQNDSENAIEYYKKGMASYEDAGDKSGIAASLNNIGLFYDTQGNYTLALEYFSKSFNIVEELGDKNGIMHSLNNLAGTNLKIGQTEKALVFAKKGMEIAKEMGFPETIKQLAIRLKNIFQKQNKHKEAFEMYELEIKMRDSINNEETQKAAVKKQLQYTYEKKEAVAQKAHEKELEKQQAVADEKQRRQAIVIWSVVVGLILVIGFAGYVFKTLRVTRKQKLLIEIKSREVEEKQKEILDSIHYAKRIQTALIPSEKYIHKSLNRLKKS